MPDFLVTGLPRSGLTLVAALIDSLPNAFCLNEPSRHLDLARRMPTTAAFCKWLAGDFIWTRAQLLRGETVMDRRASDGSPLLDMLHDPRPPRNENGSVEPLPIRRPGLNGDFILAAKHHTVFTAMLPTLLKLDYFTVIAIIRHPLDVIASWQQLDRLPASRGNPAGIARLWPEAMAINRVRCGSAGPHGTAV